MADDRTNDSKLRNGLLDENLDYFHAVPIDEDSGMVVFQFKTGGMSVAFRRTMTMTAFADQLEVAAERVRKYQREGWPMIQYSGH